MLFGRRNPPSWGESFRTWLWPRNSWSRSWRYVVHRLRRLRATPHKIALGCAIGVFSAFTPFFGLQFILAGLLAWLSRASILASALGTFFGNPVTFPLMWYGSFQLGNWALGLNPDYETFDPSGNLLDKSLEEFWSALLPMLVGAIPLGLLTGAIAYFLVRKASEAYQRKRLSRLALARKRIDATA